MTAERRRRAVSLSDVIAVHFRVRGAGRLALVDRLGVRVQVTWRSLKVTARHLQGRQVPGNAGVATAGAAGWEGWRRRIHDGDVATGSSRRLSGRSDDVARLQRRRHLVSGH